MTVPDRGSDDLTQQLADALGKVLFDLAKQRNEPFYLAGGVWHFQLNTDEKDDDLPRLARAVLARRDLVVPTRDMLAKAEDFETRSHLPQWYAADELRALTKETP